MRIDIEWHGETTEADLVDGLVTIGGGADDGVRLEGLPAGLVELTVTGNTHLSLTAKCTVAMGDARFPPHVPRLVLEGDAVVLFEEVVLRRPVVVNTAERRQRMATAFVAKSLFSGNDLPMVETRAATLTCVAGADSDTTFALAFSEVIVGRADEADVRLHDRSVSRRHAKVTRRGPRFTVEPCQSTNGLFVNGQRTTRRRSLTSGDVLELGQTVMRFNGPQDAIEDLTVLVPEETARVTVDESAEPQVPALVPPALLPLSPMQEGPANEFEPQRRKAKRFTAETLLMGLGGLLAIGGAALLFALAL